MLFSSSIFIFAFLPFVIFVNFILLKNIKAKNIFLVIVSLLFYAWGEPKFVFIMILSIILNWIYGILIDKYRDDKIKARIVMFLMVLSNLTIIFIFKYLMFAVSNINRFIGTSFVVPEIALPIGISFFTFQAMSYVIDVYRKDGDVQKNPLNVALYISFFPQLIAGPIVRYQTIAEQIKYREENWDYFTTGVCRFIVGMAKKVLLANTFAAIADIAFDSYLPNLSILMSWLGVIAYAFQIYYDFSGYSDMGIGLGKMFGFHFDENFDYPYISRSISEFWRRWHISLGTWFKDYVYIPLGGSRVKTKSRLVFNLFVVWFLTGVWHGANWTFIVWGLYYFVLITAEKLSKFEHRFKKLSFLKWLYTIFVVLIGWVLFRSNNISSALIYVKAMFGLNGNKLTDVFIPTTFDGMLVFFIAAAIFSLPIAKYINSFVQKKKLENKLVYNIIYMSMYIAIYILSLSYIVKGTYNPFIYFNF